MGENEKFQENLQEMETQLGKHQELNDQMAKENLKLAKIRDGFQDIQDLFLNKMNEKMAAMDRSLLDKIAADVEFMDADAGISNEEFNGFIERVPAHLKPKFEQEKRNFDAHDTNNDGVLDASEMRQLLDRVMAAEN